MSGIDLDCGRGVRNERSYRFRRPDGERIQ
jgi:hypothetical protein